MSNNKQNSIDWLFDQLEDYGSNSHLSLDWNTFDELCVQAKEMHKQEIENAYWDGGQDVAMHGSTCEQYYNEKFGK